MKYVFLSSGIEDLSKNGTLNFMWKNIKKSLWSTYTCLRMAVHHQKTSLKKLYGIFSSWFEVQVSVNLHFSKLANTRTKIVWFLTKTPQGITITKQKHHRISENNV